MNSLSAIDDITAEYNIIVNMDLEWYDSRLTHPCGKEPVVLTLEPPQYTRIWTPQLGVPDVKEPGSVEFNAQNVVAFLLRTDGYILIRSRLQLTLFCELNFKNYPFDSQICSVSLQSRSSSDDNIVLQWRETHAFRNADRFQMIGYKMVGYNLLNDSVHLVDTFSDFNVSRVQVRLNLKREWTHFLMDVYLPSALFVSMSWLSFWLEISAAPARVTLGNTAMLTLVTNSMTTREKLPKVSYIHALDVWTAFCTCFVFASLIEFAVVSYIYHSSRNRRHHRKQSQQSLTSMTTLSSSSTSSMTSISKYLDVQEPDNNKIVVPKYIAGDCNRKFSRESGDSFRNHYRHQYHCFKSIFYIRNPQSLANSIDRKCRFLFPLCFLLFNIIYWLIV
ncbi:glycine receptor subunit alpha-2-like [Oppia nitens]|uniref:glycine receptor subunit alpha-2-like n=1 Tax=Oppia nitens TaxID=1686743 RepID=UPI0023DC1F46|nr:glycine receptor subunit alpha-2-like [Oppia nitens]